MERERRALWADDVETHRLIRGRRWRVSDPRIPDRLRQHLVDELMAARRAVGAAKDATAERAARDRVQDAKVALGERGLRWWAADLDAEEVDDRILRTAQTLRRALPADVTPTNDIVASVVSVQPDRVAEVLHRS